MKNTKLSNLVVDAQGNALADLLKGGFIDIYDGTQPETADTEITNQRRAVSLQFGVPAFGPCSKGVLSANPIKSGLAESEVKQATWARIFAADHKTKIMDVSVGTKDANIILPTTHIVKNVTVTASSFTHTVAKATLGV